MANLSSLRQPLKIPVATTDQLICEDCGHQWNRVFVARWMHWCLAAKDVSRFGGFRYSDSQSLAEHLTDFDPRPALTLVQGGDDVELHHAVAESA